MIKNIKFEIDYISFDVEITKNNFDNDRMNLQDKLYEYFTYGIGNFNWNFNVKTEKWSYGDDANDDIQNKIYNESDFIFNDEIKEICHIEGDIYNISFDYADWRYEMDKNGHESVFNELFQRREETPL